MYGIVAWGQAAKTYKNKILILQKRALRLMFFGDYNSHGAPYFVSSSFLPLDLLYFKSVAILMHDIFLKTAFPINISYLFIHCCGATEGSEQQHNQDLKEIYKGRRILEFITFYHNSLHLTTLLTTMHCIYQSALRHEQLK